MPGQGPENPRYGGTLRSLDATGRPYHRNSNRHAAHPHFASRPLGVGGPDPPAPAGPGKEGDRRHFRDAAEGPGPEDGGREVPWPGPDGLAERPRRAPFRQAPGFAPGTPQAGSARSPGGPGPGPDARGSARVRNQADRAPQAGGAQRESGGSIAAPRCREDLRALPRRDRIEILRRDPPVCRGRDRGGSVSPRHHRLVLARSRTAPGRVSLPEVARHPLRRHRIAGGESRIAGAFSMLADEARIPNVAWADTVFAPVAAARAPKSSGSPMPSSRLPARRRASSRFIPRSPGSPPPARPARSVRSRA